MTPAITPACRIIGVLDSGTANLGASALQHLREADLVIGVGRTLALFADEFAAGAEQRDMGGQLLRVPEWVAAAREAGQAVVVLATGDPLCHGIARFMLNKLGHQACEVLPNLSTIQLACARLGLAWQEMKIASIHGKDAGEWQPGAGPEHGLYPLLQAVRRHAELAILTGPENSPGRIARMLQQEGLAERFTLSVVSHIEQPDEAVEQQLSISEAAGREFAAPNVVILQALQPPAAQVLFGLPDDSFQQRKPEKGLITKREVRAVSLAMLQLRRDSIVWDIGAGSGSVGLEAARLCADGHVYAIEKNEGDLENVEANRRTMGISNYTLRHGKAPEGLAEWPDPDAIFVGGSGGELAALIALALQRLRPAGVLVMNFITLENLHTATETLKGLGAEWSLSQLNISRSQPILNMQRMAAENPIWVVSATRGEHDAE